VTCVGVVAASERYAPRVGNSKATESMAPPPFADWRETCVTANVEDSCHRPPSIHFGCEVVTEETDDAALLTRVASGGRRGGGDLHGVGRLGARRVRGASTSGSSVRCCAAAHLVHAGRDERV
jgi:hypothetical protein